MKFCPHEKWKIDSHDYQVNCVFTVNPLTLIKKLDNQAAILTRDIEKISKGSRIVFSTIFFIKDITLF